MPSLVTGRQADHGRPSLKFAGARRRVGCKPAAQAALFRKRVPDVPVSTQTMISVGMTFFVHDQYTGLWQGLCCPDSDKAAGHETSCFGAATTSIAKRSICFQTTAAGVSVAQVARRYAMNANMIFKWLRDPRYAPDPEAVEELGDDAPHFLPVEIVDQPRNDDTIPTPDSTLSSLQGPFWLRLCCERDP